MCRRVEEADELLLHWGMGCGVSVDSAVAVERDSRKKASIIDSRVCSPSCETHSRNDWMVAAEGVATLDELVSKGEVGAGATVRLTTHGEEGWLRDGLRKRDM